MSNNTDELIIILNDLKELLGNSGKIERIKYSKSEYINAFRTEFDDSCWISASVPIPYNCDDPVLWVRFKISVPDFCAGISTANTQIRLRSMFQAPVDFYINGRIAMSEKYWIDFQSPELILCERSVQGTEYVCAMRIKSSDANWGGAFNCWIEYESVDSVYLDLTRFINELSFAGTLPGGKEITEKISLLLLPSLTDMLLTQDLSGLSSKLSQARELAESLRVYSKKMNIHLISHAHIDMNWLWTTKETISLVERDFSTACRLLDEFPDFRFSQSQCAAYEMSKSNHPDTFDEICDHINEGRWEVTATSWVENDENLPSGESLARQMLYSRKFWRQSGVVPKILWAPDTFGHSGNLPQLLSKSGIRRCFHSRCFPFASSDHRITSVKHQPMPFTYIWEGIDGTEILNASMEYGGNFDTSEMLRYAQDALERGSDHSMYVFGVGDHGGGPTRRDIRSALKSNDSPMLPAIKFSTTAGYFSEIEKLYDNDSISLLKHKGELNFIFEACYTSHADIKKSNRSLESKLYCAELLSLMSLNKGGVYPADILEDCWKKLLFNQFHDILGGCAISETYIESGENLAQASAVLDGINTSSLKHTYTSDDKHLSFINLLPYTIDEVIEASIPEGHSFIYEDGNIADSLSRAADGKTLVRLQNIPPLGSVVLKIAESGSQNSFTTSSCLSSDFSLKESHSHFVIDSPYYHIWLRKDSGEITTYYDKSSERFLANTGVRTVRMDRGILNTFCITNEVCRTGMTSWVYDQVRSADFLKDGAVSRVIQDDRFLKIINVKHIYGSSIIQQNIIFDGASPVITFDTAVDWYQKGSSSTSTPTLTILFEPEVISDGIISEIPFGSVKRPNKGAHYPQLRWSALEDQKGHFALFNNCKYGIYSSGSTVGIPLIRSSWEPDKNADIGHHEFKYAISAGKSAVIDSDIPVIAAKMHSPLIAVSGIAESNLLPVGELPSNLVLSCLKKAEFSDNYILRLYESLGKQTCFCLKTSSKIKAINEISPCEDNVTAVYDLQEGKCSISFNPFEIKTLDLVV